MNKEEDDDELDKIEFNEVVEDSLNSSTCLVVPHSTV